jgi:hypothetical protein
MFFYHDKIFQKYFKSFEEVTVDLCSSYKLLSNMTYPLKPGYTNVYSKLFPHSIAVGSAGRLAVHRVSILCLSGVEVREEQSDKQSYLWCSRHGSLLSKWQQQSQDESCTRPAVLQSCQTRELSRELPRSMSLMIYLTISSYHGIVNQP